jgi:hypothetical protein
MAILTSYFFPSSMPASTREKWPGASAGHAMKKSCIPLLKSSTSAENRDIVHVVRLLGETREAAGISPLRPV